LQKTIQSILSGMGCIAKLYGNFYVGSAINFPIYYFDRITIDAILMREFSLELEKKFTTK
jgi:hypothetical protein